MSELLARAASGDRESAPVGYARVVQIQREADILLLLRWNDPSEAGVVPGKIFEYAGPGPASLLAAQFR